MKFILQKYLFTDEFYKKLVALGSDGAAVMQGRKGGVFALLKLKQPCVVGVHCMAHRLELSLKSSAKNLSLWKKVEELLSCLFSFYHASPLNRDNLKETYKALGLSPLMPTRIGGTRWVGHTVRALENLWRGFPAFLAHLQEVKY